MSAEGFDGIVIGSGQHGLLLSTYLPSAACAFCCSSAGRCFPASDVSSAVRVAERIRRAAEALPSRVPVRAEL